MPANSLQNRPRAWGVLFPMVAAVMMTAGSLNVPAAGAAEVTGERCVRASTEAAPVMLADEIVRRLRRMGINFSRTQLPHPYDPVGEVC